jgi:hypothetical protein
MNKRKVKLLVENLENLLECLKLELEDEEEQSNTIKISDLIAQVPPEDDEVDYYEEKDDGPDILLNNKEEQKFYERFNLGE